MADKVRVDKWLWAVRIFKSRSISAEIIKSAKVKIGDTTLKASHLLKVGDVVVVRKEGFFFQFKVLNTIEKRVGAPLAVLCYTDLTPEEEKNKYKSWFANESRDKGTGRPTKRERRDIDGFKDSDPDFYFDSTAEEDESESEL